MFGLFKNEQDKKKALRQEIFSHLKALNFSALKDDRYAGLNILNCCVVEDPVDEGITIDPSGARIRFSSKKGEALLDLQHWSDLRRQAFHDYRRTDDEPGRSRIFFTMSYFVFKRNIDAVAYLFANDMSVGNYDDAPPGHEKHSFIAPIYYALDQPVMLKYLLDKGAKATPNVLNYAMSRTRNGEGYEAWRCIKLLLDKNKELHDTALLYINARDWLRNDQKLKSFLGLMPASGETPEQPKRKKKSSAKEKPGAARAVSGSVVSFQRTMGEDVINEHYDFEYFERLTLAQPKEGPPGTPLRETFNQLGRDHPGLRKAIDEYKKSGQSFDEGAAFSAPVSPGIRHVRIVDETGPG
jgi:hypothetical protein